ncbi:hypothetical protein AAMO2058_000207000 [Amorphochlora amoebiformis]
MMQLSTIQAVAGVVLMLHSMISMQQFRAWAKATESADSPPLDIIIECLAGMCLLIAAVFARSGNLMTIKSAPYAAKRPYDALSYRPNFILFNHRGKHV